MGEFESTPVVILAGGLATRLGNIARSVPKGLVLVAGRPFVEHQLEFLRAQGVREIILCTGHLGEQIEAHVGNGSAFGVRVRYCRDGKVALGTGGALRQALDLIDEACWVLYGDSYLRVSLPDVYRRFIDSGTLGVMTVFRNEDELDRSNVLFQDGQLLRYSKQNRLPTMAHIDYGLSLLSRHAIAQIEPEQACDLALLLSELVERRELVGYEVFDRFYEIGSPAGLAETEAYLQQCA